MIFFLVKPTLPLPYLFSFFLSFPFKLCVCGDQEIINFPHEIIIELTPIHIYKFKLSSKYCLQQIQTIKFNFLHNSLVFSFPIVYFFTSFHFVILSHTMDERNKFKLKLSSLSLKIHLPDKQVYHRVTKGMMRPMN